MSPRHLVARRGIRVAAAIGLMLCIGEVVAQTLPRQIQLILAAAPGTGTELSFRLLATEASKRLGIPFVMENQQGAGGRVAINNVMRSPKDGSVFAIMT